MIKKVEPPSIRPKLALLKRLIAVAFLVLAAAHPAAALDAVSMQLKWKHQFQFAGYYQALEQGFYRDAGLDVTIREGGPDIDVSEAVAGGKADFGVCSASVLRDWEAGRRLVVLAAIFQHSAAVILVARRADISSVADLRGRALMDTPGSDDIAAMLKREGIDYQSMLRVPHEGDPRDLLSGRADAMIAYSTNEPFVLEQLGAPYRTFAPAASGIDFYGDNLCASEAEVKAHPDRVASFRAASVKGWAYALAHKEATVDLILRKYSAKKSRDALLFEAEQTARLVGRDADRIGEQDPARWQRIAAVYRQLGLLTDDTLPAALIWDGNDGSLRRWSNFSRARSGRIGDCGAGRVSKPPHLAGHNRAAGRAWPVCQDGAAETEPDHVAAVHRPQHSRSHFHPDL